MECWCAQLLPYVRLGATYKLGVFIVHVQLVAEDPERFDDAEEEAEEDDGHPNNVPHPTRPEQ